MILARLHVHGGVAVLLKGTTHACLQGIKTTLAKYCEIWLKIDESQDFWANFAYFLPNFGNNCEIWLKIDKIWPNSENSWLANLYVTHCTIFVMTVRISPIFPKYEKK